MPPKDKKKEKQTLPDAYDQAQDLDGGIYSATYDFEASPKDTLDDGLAVSFDVNDNLYQQSFDFDDEKLRNKYPALQDAWEHYQNIKQMCESREKEEDAS